MKIYTRTGDAGQTGLFGGTRVAKDDARVEAYGTVDETNAVLGVACALGLDPDVRAVVEGIQNDLFVLGAELGCAPGKEARLSMRLIDERDVARLEGIIDRLQDELPALRSFVLPGGSVQAAVLHQARTVCRRAERRLLHAGQVTPLRAELLQYLNRLSDLLFVLARAENQRRGQAEVAWQPPRS